MGHAFVPFIPTPYIWDREEPEMKRGKKSRIKEDRSKGLLPVTSLWVLTQPLPGSLGCGMLLSIS